MILHRLLEVQLAHQWAEHAAAVGRVAHGARQVAQDVGDLVAQREEEQRDDADRHDDAASTTITLATAR